MLSSLYSGISGLLANSESISVIGNNIANVNTVAYKSQSTVFQDMVYQSVESTSGSSQIGRGTILGTVRTSFSTGSFETTDSSTDLAIGGEGFFIVRAANSESIYYTRAGDFSLDADGYMVNSNGYILQGKAIEPSTGTAYGVDVDIIISSEPSSPRATTEVGMAVNLESDSEWAGTITSSDTGTVTSVAASEDSYPAAGDYTMTTVDNGDGTYTLNVTDVSSGTTYTLSTDAQAGETYTQSDLGIDITVGNTITAGSQTFTATGFNLADADATSNYSSSITVYDSLGQSHVLTVYFTKVATTDSPATSTWEWNAVLDASDSYTGTDTIVGTGNLVFNDSGVLTSGGDAVGITCDFSGGCAQDQAINLIFGSDSGGGTTTSYPISSTTDFQTQDGYAPGTLTSLSVDENGIIYGTYSNGQEIALYELTLASFNNPNGLRKEGGNLYSATEKSGVAYTNSAGEGGLGTISSNSLEQSNVDLATEFVRMIVAERGYQANSKVITTTDEMLQELMNIKR